jgi:hypothetical protein
MKTLPTPHGDKLTALLENEKLPESDKQAVTETLNRYKKWLSESLEVKGKDYEKVDKLVSLLNDYKLHVELNLVFDSQNDFLYRQKGQIKLDNTIIEEFLPVLIAGYFSKELKELNLIVGPATCFSGVWFESSMLLMQKGGGLQLRQKDHDFTISRKIYLQASYKADFSDPISQVTNIAYIASECKTNLDKTMFQEAAATALDIKTAVPSAKYYLLCEWLDMTPISTSTTAIDEVIILRKAKRLSSNIRQEFNLYANRKKKRAFYEKFLKEHQLATDAFIRFLENIEKQLRDDTEAKVLERGYF